jgi:hypothetical protein
MWYIFCPLVNPKSLSERERERKRKCVCARALVDRERDKKKKKKREEEDEEEQDQVTWDKIDLQKSGSHHPPNDAKLLIFVLVL